MVSSLCVPFKKYPINLKKRFLEDENANNLSINIWSSCILSAFSQLSRTL